MLRLARTWLREDEVTELYQEQSVYYRGGHTSDEYAEEVLGMAQCNVCFKFDLIENVVEDVGCKNCIDLDVWDNEYGQ